MNYIFVDEIQEIQDFRLAIRSLALDDNNDIYVTGSNSEIFSSDLANELGGRYVEFVVYSLSYIEFLDFHELENTDASLEKYIHYGGLPYLIHLPMEEPVVMEYLRSIYSTIILKDVIQRKNIIIQFFISLYIYEIDIFLIYIDNIRITLFFPYQLHELIQNKAFTDTTMTDHHFYQCFPHERSYAVNISVSLFNYARYFHSTSF